MKPAVKQYTREKEVFMDGVEDLPVTLEEVMLRKKIQLEQDFEMEKKRVEKMEKLQERKAQIMMKSIIPDTADIKIQTEDPTLRAQSRVISLEIEPPEVVIPKLKPPTVYMAED